MGGWRVGWLGGMLQPALAISSGWRSSRLNRSRRPRIELADISSGWRRAVVFRWRIAVRRARFWCFCTRRFCSNRDHQASDVSRAASFVCDPFAGGWGRHSVHSGIDGAWESEDDGVVHARHRQGDGASEKSVGQVVAIGGWDE